MGVSAQHRWTNKEIKRVHDLRMSGIKYSEMELIISEEFGRTISQHAARQAHNVNCPHTECKGKIFSVIYPPDKVKVIRELWKKGKSLKYIIAFMRIHHDMKISKVSLGVYMYKHRDMFPYRQPRQALGQRRRNLNESDLIRDDTCQSADTREEEVSA